MSPLSRALVKQLSLALIDQSTGDNSLAHLKFTMEAHLSVAQSFCGDVQHARAELSKARLVLESICSLAGEGDRWTRKKSELRFQLALASSQVLFEGSGGGEEEKNEALALAREAKELLAVLPENSADLGVFCYNCGVKEHRGKCFDSSVAWIQLSVDSFDRLHNAQNLCRSLRLLAATHLTCSRLEQAKIAVMVALEIDHSALSLAMLCRVHLLSDDRASLEQSLSRLLQQAPDLTLSIGADLCQELRTRKEHILATWALRQLADRFANDSGLGLVRVEQLRLALESDSDETARSLMDSFASSHHAGTVRLSAPVCADMVRICFDQGVKCRTVRNDAAASWIGLAISLSASSSLDSEGRAQLHRLLASLQLEANDVIAAIGQAKSAVQLSPSVAAGHYLLARCHMHKDNATEACASIASMAGCKDYTPALMFNLASWAQTQGLMPCMVDALERFLATMEHVAANTQDFVAAARALVRVLSTSTDFAASARIIMMLYSRCQEAGGWNVVYPDLPQNREGEWCAKALYNVAGLALYHKNIGYAASLFDVAAIVCGLQSATQNLVVNARRLAVSCFLDAATTCTTEQLERAQEHLNELRQSGVMDKDEQLLLEFKLSLLSPSLTVADAVSFVSRCSTLSSSPNLFERMASACVQLKSKGLAEAASRALSISFRMHVASRPHMNTERAAVVVRNLVSFGTFGGGDESQLSQIREIAELVKAEPTWPLHDKQYLALEIWNIGAREWRRSRIATAENWCSMALGLGKTCGPEFTSAALMKTAYNQLLASLAADK